MCKAPKKEKDIVTYGRLAHWLNLLGGDLTVQQVIKHFRNHQMPGACSVVTRKQSSHSFLVMLVGRVSWPAWTPSWEIVPTWSLKWNGSEHCFKDYEHGLVWPDILYATPKVYGWKPDSRWSLPEFGSQTGMRVSFHQQTPSRQILNHTHQTSSKQ